MSEKKTLILIDVFGLLYKFFYTLPTMVTQDGQPTNAAYGFARTLLKIHKEIAPDYLIPAMESRIETFRHKIFPEYKAHRDKMPENLQSQIPIVIEIMQAMGLPQAQADGFEADDIIGTLSRIASEKDIQVSIITGDKDLLQLVNDHTTVLLSKKGVSDLSPFNREEVFNTLGVYPEHVIDLKSLEGDKSDNIPGVPGIGVKTALDLLNRFTSVDNIYENIDKIEKEKLKEKLTANRDIAFLSKELATIRTDAPLPFDIDEFPFNPILNSEALASIFSRYSFRSLEGDLQSSKPSSQPKFQNDDSYHLSSEVITDKHRLIALLEDIKACGHLCIDLETSGLDVINDVIVGISLSISPGKAYYIPIRHCLPDSVPVHIDIFDLDDNSSNDISSHNDHYITQLSPDFVLDLIESILEDINISKYGHNLKYDYLMLRSAGIQMQGITFDSMIASYLLNPIGRSHSLKSLAGHILNMQFETYTDIVGKGKDQKSFQEIPIEIAAKYACNDVDMVLRIQDVLLQQLEEKAILSVFTDIEMPLVTVLAEMEFAGVSLDTSMLRNLSIIFTEKENELVSNIHKAAGYTLNPNSPKQIAELLFDKLNLPQIRKRSTDMEVLTELTGTNEIIPLLIDFRKVSKLRGTYIDALPALIKKKTGCVHTSFNQHITATGRLSSSNPNLQNIPVRTQDGREIRKAFIPRTPDYVIISADYSQVEIRLLANLCGDPTLIHAFHNNEDIHSRTAAEVFGIPIDNITKEQRSYAKTINFGIIYGMREFRLAKELGISRQQAKVFIEQYFEKYPGINQFIEETQMNAIQDGYVTTMFGRKRWISELNSRNKNEQQGGLRAAFNTIIQGTAADIMKIAMIRIKNAIVAGDLKALMIMQVHDELVFEVSKDHLKESAHTISSIMQNAPSPFLELDVPLLVDISSGPNWLDTEPITDFS